MYTESIQRCKCILKVYKEYTNYSEEYTKVYKELY